MSNPAESAISSLRAPVSVCLACYNGERYIAEQLQSVLAQLMPTDEVIVCDDASTDKTVDVVRGIGDARIRIYQNKASLGIVRNFEQALQNAQHDCLFLCDQDDVWLPNKVERMLAALADAVMVVSDCRVVDAQLETLHPSFFALRGSRPGIANNLWRMPIWDAASRSNAVFCQGHCPFRRMSLCTTCGWAWSRKPLAASPSCLRCCRSTDAMAARPATVPASAAPAACNN